MGSTFGALDLTDEKPRLRRVWYLRDEDEDEAVWCVWGERPSQPIGTSRGCKEGQLGKGGLEMERAGTADPSTQGQPRVGRKRPGATQRSEAQRAEGSCEGREKRARGPQHRAE
ncbi:hypothetical protein DFH07DRAFT_774923 [Mycena maculata]|uniref:Uncharacterized protein n=1 Tax=Mycena maculata TaxID=230809 RepID=A0AAD7IVF3_9AGAR|nr:hypothetical protein DFH07DRAFT_774923 [Mycena maculata]